MYSEADKINLCKNKAVALSCRYSENIEISRMFNFFYYQEDSNLYNRLFPMELDPRGGKIVAKKKRR
jgi:hypothetical protein